MDVPFQVVHNASIMNAAGCCGLQLYNFGRTVSIVFFTDTWRPDSFYDKIRSNATAKLHTLCLLGEVLPLTPCVILWYQCTCIVLVDIKVKEQSIENLIKGRKVYEPSRSKPTASRVSAPQKPSLLDWPEWVSQIR